MSASFPVALPDIGGYPVDADSQTCHSPNNKATHNILVKMHNHPVKLCYKQTPQVLIL